MAIEATTLMRFVYATFAMRRQWENKAYVAIAGGACVVDGSDDAVMAPRAPPAATPVVEATSPLAAMDNHVDESPYYPSQVGSEDIMGIMLPVLESVLSAQMAVGADGVLDDSIIQELRDLSKLADDAGAFGDVVKLLVTILLDMVDTENDVLPRSVSEILLLLSFEAPTANSAHGTSFTPTVYHGKVLAQIDETLTTLFARAAADDLASHAGVRWLVHTHSVITHQLETTPEFYGTSISV